MENLCNIVVQTSLHKKFSLVVKITLLCLDLLGFVGIRNTDVWWDPSWEIFVIPDRTGLCVTLFIVIWLYYV